MSIWAISLVLNEADIIATTLQHLLDQGVDGIVVADNGSTDGTAEIIVDFERTFLVPAPGGFQQADRMTRLANHVHEKYKAEWIIPFDADELWCAQQEGSLADALDGAGATIVPFFNHYPTNVDPETENAFDALPWRWSTQHGTKMAAKYHRGMRIGLGSHQMSYHGKLTKDRLFIHHFPWRSLEHYRRKTARASRMSNNLLRALQTQGDAGFEQFYFEDPTRLHERPGWPPGRLIHDPWRAVPSAS